MGVFLEKTPHGRSYSKKEDKEMQGTSQHQDQNMEYTDLESRREARELRKEMEEIVMSDLRFTERQWNRQSEIRNDAYTVHYFKSEKAERGIVIVANKSIVRSDVKKTVYNDRITALKIKAELVLC